MKPPHRRPREPFVLAACAAAVAAALVWLGPPGNDLAAHVYQRGLFLDHGFVLWNNFWYAGRYSFVTYSLLYYPAAALVGIRLLAVLSAAAAALAFCLVAGREWGSSAKWASRMFAPAAGAAVITGAFPYALGSAVALTALATLQAHRYRTFGILVALTLAVSPLAFLLLVVVLAGLAAARRGRALVRPAVAVAGSALAAAALWRIFPDGGRFPFPAEELVAAVGFCAAGLALTWRVERARPLRYVFGAYLLACTAAYLVPSGLGENVVRLRFVAVPLAALTLSLRRWQPLPVAVAAMALALSWNATPLAFSFARGAADPSANAAYWAPAIGYLRHELRPSYRVEAVDTAGHWDAVYLADAGIPLARGWFRQDDFPQNAALYRDLSSRSYLRWLRRLGVGYVVLTAAPPDYSSRGEATLLRSGRSGLAPVFREGPTTIFAVPAPRRIVTGPGSPHVLALSPSGIRVTVGRPGSYRLAVRYSPYWRADGACVTEAADGMVKLQTRRAGEIRLLFEVTPDRAIATLAGAGHACEQDGSAQPGPPHRELPLAAALGASGVG